MTKTTNPHYGFYGTINGDLVEAYNRTSETHGELHVADKWLLQFARNVLGVSR